MATREQGIVYDATVATTGEQTCFTMYGTSQGRRGGCVYVYASAAGTLKFYHGFPSGNYREIKSQAIAATTGTLVDFDFHIADLKVTWTSDSGSSLTVEAEGFTY